MTTEDLIKSIKGISKASNKKLVLEWAKAFGALLEDFSKTKGFVSTQDVYQSYINALVKCNDSNGKEKA